MAISWELRSLFKKFAKKFYQAWWLNMGKNHSCFREHLKSFLSFWGTWGVGNIMGRGKGQLPNGTNGPWFQQRPKRQTFEYFLSVAVGDILVRIFSGDLRPKLNLSCWWQRNTYCIQSRRRRIFYIQQKEGKLSRLVMSCVGTVL